MGPRGLRPGQEAALPGRGRARGRLHLDAVLLLLPLVCLVLELDDLELQLLLLQGQLCLQGSGEETSGWRSGSGLTQGAASTGSLVHPVLRQQTASRPHRPGPGQWPRIQQHSPPNPTVGAGTRRSAQAHRCGPPPKVGSPPSGGPGPGRARTGGLCQAASHPGRISVCPRLRGRRLAQEWRSWPECPPTHTQGLADRGAKNKSACVQGALPPQAWASEGLTPGTVPSRQASHGGGEGCLRELWVPRTRKGTLSVGAWHRAPSLDSMPGRPAGHCERGQWAVGRSWEHAWVQEWWEVGTARHRGLCRGRPARQHSGAAVANLWALTALRAPDHRLKIR